MKNISIVQILSDFLAACDSKLSAQSNGVVPTLRLKFDGIVKIMVKLSSYQLIFSPPQARKFSTVGCPPITRRRHFFDVRNSSDRFNWGENSPGIYWPGN
jgi:hypothetical protein